jgi:maltose alpha-D-glucosyltransferase/alpha-amylase
MVRSFHYAAYASLYLDNQIRPEDLGKLIPFVEQWYHYMSNLFIKAYLDTVKDSAFIPKEKEDLETLLTTFLLEKAIYELNYELNNRPAWINIPLNGIKALMHKTEMAQAPATKIPETAEHPANA